MNKFKIQPPKLVCLMLAVLTSGLSTVTNAEKSPTSVRVANPVDLGSVFTPTATTAALPSQLQVNPLPQNLCPVAATKFKSWFKANTVALNGEVLPANSLTFPDIPNCSFYEWSEQMFLWLTSPTPKSYGGGGGRIFESPVFFDVSPLNASNERTLIPHVGSSFIFDATSFEGKASGNQLDNPRMFSVRTAQMGPNDLPIIFDKSGKMLEVLNSQTASSGRSLVNDAAGKAVEIERVEVTKNKKPVFFDNLGKKINVQLKWERGLNLSTGRMQQLPSSVNKANLVQSFKVGKNGAVIFINGSGNVVDVEVGQAGGANPVLMAQNGSLVYYTTIVNDVFAYFVTGVKNTAFSATHFPTNQADLDFIINYAQNLPSRKTFPDPEALAIEVKAAWIETTNLNNLNEFITTTATIPTFDQSDLQHQHWPLIPNGSRKVTLALVGMHVVGSTKGHPEMIWATFEHSRNTPIQNYSYTNAGGGTSSTTQINANPVTNSTTNPATNWLFSATNTVGGLFNDEKMHFEPLPPGSTIPRIEATTTNNPNQTIDKSDTIRRKAWGAASNVNPNPLKTVAQSNAEIISINSSVISQLVSGDVRSNYIMTGATWTKFGQPPNQPPFTPNFGGTNPNNQFGTSKLANTTMETYQQGTATTATTPDTNCFSCHQSNQVGVSRIYNALQPLTNP